MSKKKLSKGVLKTIAGGICYGITAMTIPATALGFVGIAGGGMVHDSMDKSAELKTALEAEARPAIVRYWEGELESGNMSQAELLQETLDLREGDSDYVYNYVKDNEVLSEEFSGSLKAIEENNLKCKLPKDITDTSCAIFLGGILLWLPTYIHYAKVGSLPGKETLDSGLEDIKEAKAEKVKE